MWVCKEVFLMNKDTIRQIKFKLLEKNLKQIDIAAALGYSRYHLNNILSGRRKSEKFNKWVKENLGVLIGD